MATLIITSTQQVAKALAPKLEELGHKIIIFPLLNIKPIKFTPPTKTPSAILVTSRYALDSAEQYKDQPLYVVGEQSAKLALAKGHYIARVSTDVTSIISHLPDNTLYLRGRDVSHELNLESRICYQAEALEPINDIPECDAFIVLSARAAALLPETAKTIFCLSKRISENLQYNMQTQAIILNSPEEFALIEAIKNWHAK